MVVEQVARKQRKTISYRESRIDSLWLQLEQQAETTTVGTNLVGYAGQLCSGIVPKYGVIAKET